MAIAYFVLTGLDIVNDIGLGRDRCKSFLQNVLTAKAFFISEVAILL